MPVLLIASCLVLSFALSQWAPIFKPKNSGGADCGGLPPLSKAMAMPRITAIFRGTVSEIKGAPDGQLVTFRVARVWKGDVASETVVYNQMAWLMVDTEKRGPHFLQQPDWARPFELGDDYLVVT